LDDTSKISNFLSSNWVFFLGYLYLIRYLVTIVPAILASSLKLGLGRKELPRRFQLMEMLAGKTPVSKLDVDMWLVRNPRRPHGV
jgi:hypothetical protein